MKNNWQIKKLSAACKVFTDGDWIESKDQSDSGVRLIQTGNIGNGFFKDREEKARYISEETFKRLNCEEIFPGDCFVSRLPDPVGRACIIPQTDQKMITAVDCTIIRFNESVLPDWFNYYAQSVKYLSEVNREATGTTRKRISRKNLGDIEIPTPPIEVQKRIVKILDEAFEKIAEAKENTEKNLQNSKELFESYLQTVFANPEIEWKERKLGDKEIFQIIDGDRGKNYPNKTDFSQKGYCLFLNTKNVRPDGFNFKTIMFVTEEKDEALGNGKLQRNDVLLTTRGTIGNIAVYDKNVPFENIRINSGMLIFRSNTKLIVPEYLFKIFQSEIMKTQIRKHVSGAAQPQLPIKTLVNFSIPVPKSLTEQKVIVGKLDSFSEQTKNLEENYKKKLENLDELKKSILKKAFEGEL